MVTLGTESVYIGRSLVSPDKIYIGPIQPKEGMSVDFYGESAKLGDCEILVSGDDDNAVQEVTNVTNFVEHDNTDKDSTETNNLIPPVETAPIEMSVFNDQTVDVPTEAEIENDNGLLEYEELEDKTAQDEYGTSLELIEENDENVST